MWQHLEKNGHLREGEKNHKRTGKNCKIKSRMWPMMLFRRQNAEKLTDEDYSVAMALR